MNKKSNYITVLTLLTPAISKSIMNNFINREITNYNYNSFQKATL